MRPSRRAAVVAALVAVDLAVVLWAVVEEPRSSSAVSADSAREPHPAATSGPGESGRGSGHVHLSGPVILAVDASGAILRVSEGSCDHRVPPPRAWVAPPTQPARAVVAPPLRTAVTASATEHGFVVVGRDDDCRLAAVRTADGGRSWQSVSVPPAWVAERIAETDVPREAGVDGALPPDVELRDPRGEVRDPGAGCSPLAGVAVTGEGVPYLVCARGAVIGLERDAPTGPWELVGVRYVSLVTPQQGVALVADDDCDARAYVLDDGGADWLPTQCLGQGKEPLGLTTRSEVALAQVGEDLMVSADGGRSWRAR